MHTKLLLVAAVLLFPWTSWAKGRDFVWYCESDQASVAQKRTVEALTAIANLRPNASCEAIRDKLKTKRFINMPDEGLTDLSPVKGFTQIESMDLSFNSITSTKMLENLPALEQLFISNNKLTATPRLKASRKLILLNIGYNPISSIGSLEHFGSLKKLYIDSTEITDFSALTNRSLRKLSLMHLGQDADLSTLPTLPNLQDLSLDKSFIMTDLTGLTRFSKLRRLTCRSCGISSVAGAAQLTRLRTLTLEGNAISTIGRGQLPASLNSLDLSSNPIKDFAFLSELPKMSWTLNLDNTGFHDWRQVMSILPNLRYFYAAFTPVKEMIVEGPQHWPVMTVFDIGGTKVSSLAPMKNVTASQIDIFFGPDFEKLTEDICPTTGVPMAVADFCGYHSTQH